MAVIQEMVLESNRFLVTKFLAFAAVFCHVRERKVTPPHPVGSWTLGETPLIIGTVLTILLSLLLGLLGHRAPVGRGQIGK